MSHFYINMLLLGQTVDGKDAVDNNLVPEWVLEKLKLQGVWFLFYTPLSS